MFYSKKYYFWWIKLWIIKKNDWEVYKVFPRTNERIAIWSPISTCLLELKHFGGSTVSAVGFGIIFLGVGNISTVRNSSSTHDLKIFEEWILTWNILHHSNILTLSVILYLETSRKSFSLINKKGTVFYIHIKLIKNFRPNFDFNQIFLKLKWYLIFSSCRN